MAEKKRIYESSVMALPPLRLVLGDVPSPEPDGKPRARKTTDKPGREMEAPVKKLIAHLKDEKDA
jgi:hypothetical protein